MDDDSDDGVEEGVGESSWPAGPAASSSSGGANGNGPLSQDVRKGIYHRLRDIGNEEALSDPFFEQLLDEHYERLPVSYSIDLQVEKAEDVLLHRRILAECAHPDKRPVFHARFLGEEKPKDSHPTQNGHGGGPLVASLREVDFQEFPCERMMEDLSLGKRKGVGDFEAISAWRDTPEILLIHEITFSSSDNRKLLGELSALLSELDLNIREAHVFSTTDGLCLGVFVVDGWETEETDGLMQQLKVTANHYNNFIVHISVRIETSTDHYVPSSLEAIVQDRSRPHAISLQHLKQITDNFSEERILGKGGFGVVYKGLFQNGDMIAVKKIMSSLMPGLQKQFENEVYHLMTLKHPNIVRCLGYCYEIKNACVEYNGKYVFAEMAEKLLCLEYLPKGSLDKYLSDESSGFNWSTRYKIIEGICYGLLHLHEQIGQPIIHLDLKPANILLDDGFIPKITDFGLSRQLDQLQTICTSTYDGTFGYMAPEFLHRGTITPKSDIFSLGVIIMEVVTGHRDYPDVTRESSDNYIELALKKWRDVLQRLPGYGSLETNSKGQPCAGSEEGSHYFGSLVRSLSLHFKWLFSRREPVTSCSQSLEKDCEQIKRCIQIGLICVSHDRRKRPPITKVISMLQGSDIIDYDISNEEA